MKNIFNRRFFRRPVLIFTFITACIGYTHAQQTAPAARLLQAKQYADSLIRQNPAERIYLHTDKSTYTPADTLWFKAYLFNAHSLTPSVKSGIMYVTIITDSNKVVKQQRLPVENGLTWGNISLDDLPAGNYVLTAYTQWMQNFSKDGFFYRQFTIADDARSNWMANYSSTSTMVEGKEQAHVKLQLSDTYKKAVIERPVQLLVMKGKRRLYRSNLQTDEKGLIDITFNLPAKPGDIRIIANDAAGNRVDIPLNFNRPQDADIQFMPEGGTLIDGLPARIGFKAIGLDGRGIEISGTVFNENHQPVTDFKSSHLGMGSFEITPKADENYTAKITLPGGQIKDYALPKAKSNGIVLRVSDKPAADSIVISLQATDNIRKDGESYFLIGKSFGVICYGSIVNFKQSGSINGRVSKKLFPSGIAHFMLLDMKNRPLNERLVFINLNDNLHVNIGTSKITYAARDSVALNINVTDAAGKPVQANFSLAVTDDAQVHPDSLNNENIITRMLLTSELKGYVEQPNYYLNANDYNSHLALDNLLLTQGWVSYDWDKPKGTPLYAAETELAIKGKVLNVFNKPVKKTRVQLFSKSPLMASDTLTDASGSFTFRNLPLTDTPAYFIKTAKNFNVGIVMDDAPTPTLSAPAAATFIPWYVSNDTTLFNSLKTNRIKQNLANDLPADMHTLREVKIKAKKIVKGSKNLNGAGNADYVFDEGDLLKAGKKTWVQFLTENVKSFREGTIIKQFVVRFSVQGKTKVDLQFGTWRLPPSDFFSWYFVDNKPIFFVVDGIALGDVFKSNFNDDPDFTMLKNYLEGNNAEDIKGIEINTGSKYSDQYFGSYVPSDWKPYAHVSDFTFMEITTRGGYGPNIDKTPGGFLYKPLALSFPSQFYSPKYLVNNAPKVKTDLRSTIYWQPNVVTGADGKAVINFYTADMPSSYTIMLNGTDMTGGFGFKQGGVKVGTPAP
ncbi:carboxypeptidase-like regulatory domain-containing protein [Mucilaginibacter celer]|uniref:Carboxypeptidase regulatory-like domain-containing protein n=1 Tax=Mucilaginibacter celer TaxID=2305508 RepID=A0A494W3H3_9SPHI|nr:carboxypeptidase-like regulatory domain-containing protein [Mucilaginibacter celer]AYL97862.1 carboxypeptidase regulatory-like domain-containing protein [Mucilaginibacter celer]